MISEWGIVVRATFLRTHRPFISRVFIHVFAVYGTHERIFVEISESQGDVDIRKKRVVSQSSHQFEKRSFTGMDLKSGSTAEVGAVSRSIEIGLRLIGVWPDSPYAILHRAFWMITLTAAQTFQYRYFVVHVHTDDLSHLMDGLSTTMSYSLLLLKLTIFWIHRR